MLFRFDSSVSLILYLQSLWFVFRRMRFKKEEANTAGVKVEMEIKNLKLYMENQSIIEENERLRKKAFLLHKENQVLLSQLQNFSKQKPLPSSNLSAWLEN